MLLCCCRVVVRVLSCRCAVLLFCRSVALLCLLCLCVVFGVFVVFVVRVVCAALLCGCFVVLLVWCVVVCWVVVLVC